MFLFHEFGIFLSFLFCSYHLYPFLFMPFFYAGMDMFGHCFQVCTLVLYIFYFAAHYLHYCLLKIFLQTFFHISAYISNFCLSLVHKLNILSNSFRERIFSDPFNDFITNVFSPVPQIVFFFFRITGFCFMTCVIFFLLDFFPYYSP